jgi:uncharacterized membrane protein
MLRANPLLTGLAIGAGATYFFDAAQGKRRRKLLADQFNHFLHSIANELNVSWRDLKNRARGTAAQGRRMLDFGEVSDDVVVERVRAQLGHYASHARRIDVGCSGGHVVLRGPVSSDELIGLLRGVAVVPGVRTVTDELVVKDHEGNGVPAKVARKSWDFVHGDWTPATKLLAGTTGGVLLVNCLTARRRYLSDVVLGTLGFGMLIRSLASNQRDAASNWQRVEFHKTLLIHAPIEKVFSFITTPGNWALITTKIFNLRWHSDDAFAKEIVLPGMNLYCSERIVCRKDNECFATESLPDSWLTFNKELDFERAGDATRLHLKFSYLPPGGALGHAVGAMFGLDAKSFFDDFLMRAKTYLETGEQPHDVPRQYGPRQSVDAGPSAPPHEAAPNQPKDSPLWPANIES